MKRNVRQSFRVSASHIAESAMFPVIRHPRLFWLTANEKDFSLLLEMTMREGGTLPPSLGRRCPEGAEARSLSGMKRNARQSFHVSASRAAGSAVLPVIPLLTAVLDRERKRFLAFARNDDARRRHTPSFPRKEVPRRGGGWLPKWDERDARRPSPCRHPERSRGIFFVSFFRCRHV